MQKLEDLTFEDEYFCDEVREGFFVSEMMKRFWAAQLEVLREIHLICLRHDINWYASMGTLIGVVRHKGYIPWDDDLDIVMVREDYDRFMEYARKELPEGYVVLTVHDNEEYTNSIGRITNGNTIDLSADHMRRYHGCPYVVGVDIFPADRIYSDPEKDEDRRSRALELINTIEKGKVSAAESRKLLLKLEDTLSECKDDDFKENAVMYVWITNSFTNVPRDIYDKWQEMPFENTYLRAPVKYHELLTLYYNDYMTVKRGTGVHKYPVYQDQEEILREKLGHNPYRYTFDKENFVPAPRRKGIMEQYKEVLEKLRAAGMDDVAEETENKLKGLIGNRKTILFLPCRVSWWDTMEKAFDEAVKNPDNDVYVIPTPYYIYDRDRKISEPRVDTEEFKKIPKLSGHLTDFDNYNIVKDRPNTIVTQVPFDGDSYSMTIPETLYTKNLTRYTDDVCYIPCFDPDPPISPADSACEALKLLVEQPAVFDCDRMIVSNEGLKAYYVDQLVNLSGEENRWYWEDKIELPEESRW